MANILKTSFSVENKYEAFYTGGKIEVCKDGVYMFCGCGNQVKVLEIETGKIFTTIGQDEEISRFCLSPDSQYIVLATQMLLFRLWDWKEQVLIRSWKAIHIAPVSFLTFDPTSTLLASGSADSTIKVWDITREYCTHNLRGHQGVISIVKFHPDMSQPKLFSGGEDYRVRIWDLETSSCLATVEAHYSIITSMEFTNDGKTLYSAGRDGIVGIWDVGGLNVTTTIPVFENVESLILMEGGDNSVLNVTGDSVHFLTAGNKGVLRVWNTDTASCVHTQVKSEKTDKESKEMERGLTQALFIPALDAIVVTTYDHNIYVWRKSDFGLIKLFSAYNDEVLDIQFLGEKESHVAVATNSSEIRVFELSTWNCQLLHGHTDIVLSLHVHSKGKLMVSSSKDNSICLWRMHSETGLVSCVATGLGHTHAVGSVTMSRLSSAFIISGGQDCTLKLWNVPDTVKADDAVTTIHCQMTEKAHDKDINSVMVSPNDKFIATASQDRTAKLWGVDDLSLKGVMRGHKRGIWCTQFSPVDQCLVTSSGDGTIKIWALSDCSCVKTFEGHDCSVMKVIFLSKGMQLMSAGSDGLLKLWTIKSNECVKTLDEHQDKVWALVANHQEDRVITGGADSALVMWKDVTKLEIDEKKEKEENLILQEQELSNLMIQKKYLKAIGLAITLEQPFKVLGIVKEIMSTDGGEADLEATIALLRVDQIDAVLKFSVKWNMNSKHCHEAQYILSTILKAFPAEELLKFPNIKTTVEGLLPYTDRHFERMNRLLQQSKFVDYIWQCMRMATAGSGKELTMGDDVHMIDDMTDIREVIVKRSTKRRENKLFTTRSSDKDAAKSTNPEVTSTTVKINNRAQQENRKQKRKNKRIKILAKERATTGNSSQTIESKKKSKKLKKREENNNVKKARKCKKYNNNLDSKSSNKISRRKKINKFPKR